jgi:hypothetical protein
MTTRAAARMVRADIVCPVCGQGKVAGALLCSDCIGPLDWPLRNSMNVDTWVYIEQVRVMRAERQLGLRISR